MKAEGDRPLKPEQSRSKKKYNQLRFEKSPYLLQHASNPVDWNPWSAEIFERARREDRPLFLSIGYSTCHWCHVMERESFRDPEAARLLNRTFVCVKVDREERPDIDAVYMAACQTFTGSGGWPLTIVMTPEQKPFFAATYVPRENRYGRAGLLQLVPRIAALWSQRRADVEKSADEITAALQVREHAAAGAAPGAATIDAACQQLGSDFDWQRGGFGTAPKFPAAHNLLFLLRCWKRGGETDALAMVRKTLDAMAAGGIYDQLGFGFHRYATDPDWLVPHFEKMLYDQAMLVLAYSEAFQAACDESHGRIARQVLDYVLRDMTSPEGGFYCAEDADSGGVEGGYYLWSLDEIKEALPRGRAERVQRLYGVSEQGNAPDPVTGRPGGANILHLRAPLAEQAKALGMTPEALETEMEQTRRALLNRRRQRPRPFLDDKILTDWTGLMTAALARAAQVFGNRDYAAAARRAADFIRGRMRAADGTLLHRYRGGEAAIPGLLDDYAFSIWGLLDLHRTSLEKQHLETALELNELLLERFWDRRDGGFYLTPEPGEKLLIRVKTAYDGALPSGNSAALFNLMRLARLTGREDLQRRAEQTAAAFAHSIRAHPAAHTHSLSAIAYGLNQDPEDF